MKRISTAAILMIAAVTAAPAMADQTLSRSWANGTTAVTSVTKNNGVVSRNHAVAGVSGGTVDVSGSCAKYEGCSREWSRTLRNGQTASGSVSAARGEGVSRSGSGFRHRNW